MKFDQLNESRIKTLYPPFAAKIKLLLLQCQGDGFDVLIAQALRTIEEQNSIYAQGRTKPGKIVTKAKGGSSYHNFGLAIDFVPLTAIGKADWDEADPHFKDVVKIGKSIGLEWGGDWKSIKDYPHLQLTYNVKLPELRAAYKTGKLPACWKLVDEAAKKLNKG